MANFWWCYTTHAFLGTSGYRPSTKNNTAMLEASWARSTSASPWATPCPEVEELKIQTAAKQPTTRFQTNRSALISWTLGGVGYESHVECFNTKKYSFLVFHVFGMQVAIPCYTVILTLRVHPESEHLGVGYTIEMRLKLPQHGSHNSLPIQWISILSVPNRPLK